MSNLGENHNKMMLVAGNVKKKKSVGTKRVKEIQNQIIHLTPSVFVSVRKARRKLFCKLPKNGKAFWVNTREASETALHLRLVLCFI